MTNGRSFGPKRYRRSTAGGLGLVLFLAVLVTMPAAAGARSATAGGARRRREHGNHAAGSATSEGPDGVQASWVVRENRKPGTASWRITGNQSPTGIMGYASRVQAKAGQQVELYVSTPAPTFQVTAYRMGYYQGLGARRIWRSKAVKGVVQPACPVTPGINMVECHWSPSLRLTIDRQWVQGEYLLKLVGSGGQQSYVPLTVWDPTSQATYVVMEGVFTQQVFNAYGGYDLYQGATPCEANHYPCSSRSRVVSFDRPYTSGNGSGTFLSLVYPLTRFMERHGLDVTYWTDFTLDEHPNLATDHKVLISTGHDEEWSLAMRQGAVAARDRGVNLVFLGASPVLRKVRLQASPLGPNREIVNYRNPQADPVYATDPAAVSQNWWGQPPANEPASTLVGGSYVGYNNSASFPLVVSQPTSWLFAGTGLGAGAQIPGVLSTDFQAFDPSRSGNPPDLEILAHSPVTIELHGAGFADTTYYTMPSGGAGVFESGANTWIPSLAACSPPSASCPAALMRHLTGNLLAVFGQGPVGRSHPSVANWQQFYG